MHHKMDEVFMQRALDLAIRGFAKTGKNPMVGAVIVHRNRVIGEGYHEIYGSPHAEINAINSVQDEDKLLLSESTLYVTLEPCSHFGKTPPCAHRIVAERIPKVVIGVVDPNPKVAGNGIRYLIDNGINVVMSSLRESSESLIRKFKVNLLGVPFIQLKWAQSKDGFMGIKDRQVWLSNGYARLLTHRYRSLYDGILVGKHTALTDNPILDARYDSDKRPIRILLDSHLEVPISHHLYNGSATTWIINHVEDKVTDKVRFIKADTKDLSSLMNNLFDLGLTSVIVEGGAQVLSSFIESNLWHEAFIIKTNKILEAGISAPLVEGRVEKVFHLADNDVLIIRNTNFEQ